VKATSLELVRFDSVWRGHWMSDSSGIDGSHEYEVRNAAPRRRSRGWISIAGVVYTSAVAMQMLSQSQIEAEAPNAEVGVWVGTWERRKKLRRESSRG
jgi:hypothetical protein